VISDWLIGELSVDSMGREGVRLNSARCLAHLSRLVKLRNSELTGSSIPDRLNTKARLKSGDKAFESKF